MSKQQQRDVGASSSRCSFLVRAIAGVLFMGVVTFAVFGDEGLESTASASSVVQAKDRQKDPQVIAEGAKLFAPSCGNAYCHGSGGMGGGAPRLRGKGLEADYLFKSISNGIPRTPMLGFKSEFSEEQIWKLVAFIMSDSKTGTPVEPAEELRPSPSIASVKPAEAIAAVGNSEAGKAIFFDSAHPKSCHACHSIGGEGTSIGPDLSLAANKSARELFLGIILAREIKDSRYATITVTLRNGDKIVGVKKEEDEESIRVYDTTELPAVLRTIQKTGIAKVEASNESIMPKDYAAAYTVKQLLDLVTFLRSSGSKSPVTLRDLFQ